MQGYNNLAVSATTDEQKIRKRATDEHDKATDEPDKATDEHG